MTVITGFFLDFSPAEQNYLLLVETADFSGYEKSSSLSTKWLKSSGNSMAEVFQSLEKSTPKPLYFSHAKIMLFGKGVGQNTFPSVVEYLTDNPNINSDIVLATTDASLEQMEQSEEKAICKTAFEALQKEEISNNAKLYQLFPKKENFFALPKFSLSENGNLNLR